jgi:hypothetical protein
VGVGPGGDDDAVDPRPQQGVGRGGRLRPQAVGDLGRQAGDDVGDDERVDHGQAGQGVGVELADPAQPQQSEAHGGLLPS